MSRHEHKIMEIARIIALFILVIGSLGDAREIGDYESQKALMSTEKLETKNDDSINHKPVFVDCDKYSISIEEEEWPRMEEYVKVRAVDPDPPEQGGTITYSIEKTSLDRLKFEINNVTGSIRTTDFIDRDEPYGEKEILITVMATDNGFVPLTDVCTFKMTIKDVNDNSPVFSEKSYIKSVSRNLPVGQEIMTIRATDVDEGINGIVKFNISSTEYFKIDSETGIITLNKKIDNEPGYKFKLQVRANDQGKHQHFDIKEVEIEIVE